MTYLTNKSGKTIEVTLHEISNDHVTVNLKNGTQTKIEINKLSDKDQSYLRIIEKLLIEKSNLFEKSSVTENKDGNNSSTSEGTDLYSIMNNMIENR